MSAQTPTTRRRNAERRTRDHAIVAECWTCACDGPPTCTLPHGDGDRGRMPYRLTAYRMELHKGHDVRPIPRVVAECMSVACLFYLAQSSDPTFFDKCRAAGHDVREVSR